jgi:FkbM family methyltransferase
LISARGGSRERLDAIFAGFKGEDSEARSGRWRGYFDRTVDGLNQLVLFGTGQLGQLTLDRLRRAGVEPVCFSDNNQGRWGTKIDGLEVLSPVDAVTRYGQAAAFVVTIFNGSAPRAQLRQLGCKCVVSVATLFWKYPQQFMPELGIDTPALLTQYAEQIRACFGLLSDELSRQELCDQLQWRYWLEPEFLPLPNDPAELYFPKDLIIPNDEEVVVDCGAFDGDCIRSLQRLERKFAHIYALEPDSRNRLSLQAFLRGQSASLDSRVTVWPYATGEKDGTLSFDSTGDVASKVSRSGEGTTIECRRLDSLPWTLAPTYIKMDIEASEPFALIGGSDLIRRERPVLAVCLYHRSQHLWEIPNLIHSIEPSYSLFLRRYAEDCWEQVCYAIPPSRLA